MATGTGPPWCPGVRRALWEPGAKEAAWATGPGRKQDERGAWVGGSPAGAGSQGEPGA